MAATPVTTSRPPAMQSGAKRKVLVVLGMHRSGTSALTRILNLMGCDISAKIMPGLKDNNEPGFWESQDIFEIQESMLKDATGESWDSCSTFPLSWLQSAKAKEYKNQLLGKLEADFAQSTLFVLKDPRICRLVPFWLDLFSSFDSEPYFILPLRNPLEVARSLKARDGFHFSKSFLVWLRHNLDAERDTRGLKRCFTTYEELLVDWRQVMRYVFHTLQLPEPKIAPLRDAEIEQYLSSSWRHHALTLDDVLARPELVCWVKDAYAALLGATTGDEEGLAPALDRVREAFETAELAYAPYVADQAARMRQAIEKADAMARRVEGVQAEFELLRGLLEKREAAERSVCEALYESRQKIQELESELESIQSSTSWRLTSPFRAIGRFLK